jgi:hypothetical protein
MLTLMSLGFGLLLVVAVLHTLRRMFSRSMLRGATFVVAITFCVTVGVAFLAPQNIRSVFPLTIGDVQHVNPAVLTATAVVGFGLLIMLIMGLRRLLRPLMEINTFVVLMGIVVVALLASVPLSPHLPQRDPMLAPIVVVPSFLTFGTLTLTHHFLGPIFAVASLATALSRAQPNGGRPRPPHRIRHS